MKNVLGILILVSLFATKSWGEDALDRAMSGSEVATLSDWVVPSLEAVGSTSAGLAKKIESLAAYPGKDIPSSDDSNKAESFETPILSEEQIKNMSKEDVERWKAQNEVRNAQRVKLLGSEKKDKDKKNQEISEKAKETGIDESEIEKINHRANGQYTKGTYKMSDSWLEEQNKSMIASIGQQAGQMRGIQTETKDPKTQAIALGVTAGIASVGAIANAVHYGKIAYTHQELEEKNVNARKENEQELLKLQNRKIELSKQREKSEKLSDQYNIMMEVNAIDSEIKAVEREIKKQDEADNKNTWDTAASVMKAGMSLASAGATAYMANESYKNAKKLSNDIYGSTVASTDPTLRDPIPTNVPTRDGFTKIPDPDLDLNKSDPFDSRSPSSSGGAGSGSPSLPSSGLGSGFGLSAGDDKKDQNTSDKDKKKYSKDQSFPTAGGSGDSRDSLVSFNMGDSGFDIGQFMPDWLKGGSQEEGFMFRKINSLEEKEPKTLIMGKDSPSLFTRVTKAYQKKAPELKEEVF